MINRGDGILRILLLSLTIAALIAPLSGFADNSASEDQDQGPVLILTSPAPNQEQTQSWTSSQSDSSQSQSQPDLQLQPQSPALTAKPLSQQKQASNQPTDIKKIVPLSKPAPAPVSTPEKPKPEIYGPTTPDDHIWELAVKLRPSDAVTVQQMIIALQKANPEAFEQDNINSLRPYQMLHVPGLAEIQAIAPEAALEQVETENKTWKSNQALALAEKPKPKPNSKPEEKKIAPVNLTQLEPLQKIEPLQKTEQTAKAEPLQPPALVTLNSELTTTQQELTQDQGKTEKSITALQQQEKNLTAQLHQVENKVSGLSTQTSTLNQLVSANWQEKLIPYHTKNNAVWWFIAIALFLIILLWIPMPERTNARRQEPVLNADDPEVKDEYDFMNSAEAMPAKLDLARAYIDMDDHFSAEQVLKDILAKGDDKQRQHAKKMMEELKA